MIAIQIMAVTIAILVLYINYVNYRRHDLSVVSFLFWSIIWVALIVSSLYPQLFDFATYRFHLARRFDFVMVVGFLIIFVVTYHSFLLINRLDRRIEDFIRRQAIKEAGLISKKS